MNMSKSHMSHNFYPDTDKSNIKQFKKISEFLGVGITSYGDNEHFTELIEAQTNLFDCTELGTNTYNDGKVFCGDGHVCNGDPGGGLLCTGTDEVKKLYGVAVDTSNPHRFVDPIKSTTYYANVTLHQQWIRQVVGKMNKERKPRIYGLSSENNGKCSQ
ncbi:hypothetical protein M3Y96_00599900 [Aphelenchoides besseyi]|nr:hypothetical protein M3Y96_00599900 [Aphelenchoides besseyi]